MYVPDIVSPPDLTNKATGLGYRVDFRDLLDHNNPVEITTLVHCDQICVKNTKASASRPCISNQRGNSGRRGVSTTITSAKGMATRYDAPSDREHTGTVAVFQTQPRV